ncbi:uncharacterized protein ISCGN_014047 [Ixodes scapularis]
MGSVTAVSHWLARLDFSSGTCETGDRSYAWHAWREECQGVFSSLRPGGLRATLRANPTRDFKARDGPNAFLADAYISNGSVTGSDREQDSSDESSDTDNDVSIDSDMSIDLEEESNVSSEPWSDIDLGVKKLQAASRSGLCKELEVWVQPVTNHPYFCAMMGDCNGPLLVSMWLSLLNDVVNKHSGHGGPYGECLHQPLTDRSWLVVGSPAYNKLRSIISNPRLIKDIQHLSSGSETYSVESFNSVLIKFASKSWTFSPEGMMARCKRRLYYLGHYQFGRPSRKGQAWIRAERAGTAECGGEADDCERAGRGVKAERGGKAGHGGKA